ncbi:MAG: hypothetical protein MI807_07160 [Verrucomicrobiales bacterium]|nr:hypothetical protein [Verrucomicrobiales bacterium]
MSDSQKIFASLSGAVIVHVLLLMLVFVMLSTRKSDASLANQGQPEPRQQEVTILLSELMEQVKVEPPEPEPETVPPRRRRSFFDTSTNRREAEAPENARFISDRNTTAATEILPDPNLPQQYGPTTDGDAPIDRLRLQDREYVDGRLNAAPGAQSRPAENGSADGGGIRQTAARDGVENGTGEAKDFSDGADRPPENPVAEEMVRPEESPVTGEKDEVMKKKSFADPNSSIAGSPDIPLGDEDQFAATDTREKTDEVGRAADEKEKMEQMAGIPGGRGEAAEGTAKEDKDGFGERPGDAGLFAGDGFQAFERKNSTNGKLTNMGENAVDAEESAQGKYEASVRQAIAKKWHALRVQNGDFVTYSFLKLRCRVDRNGKVHDLEVIENEANSVVTSFSLKAILEADIPRMPADVAEEYGPFGLELNYDVFIY